MLCVLLDCGLPGSPESVTNEQGEPVVEFEVASQGGFNLFRTVLSRLDTAKEMTFIFKGFSFLLRNVYQAKRSYLNSSTKLECYQELLVLLWKFLEENPLFMNHVLTQCNVNELIVPICYLSYQSRRDSAQIGLVHICTFVLLKLNGERSFGVALNRPFTTKLPTDLPLVSGGHADLLAITLRKLVVNGAYKLVPLYSCFLTIICNISPYWGHMSLWQQ
ncbi:Dyggve-Melchior-Clausen syndrome protein [Fragilaria crotonensis]|nr:Dyggve-Melchior-Clausen syndrome protein [Fragilaria crotonensis]